MECNWMRQQDVGLVEDTVFYTAPEVASYQVASVHFLALEQHIYNFIVMLSGIIPLMPAVFFIFFIYINAMDVG